MIFKNYAIDQKASLATLAILIPRPGMSSHEKFFNSFVKSQSEANTFFKRCLNKWIREELQNFSKQRMKALSNVNMLSGAFLERLLTIQNVVLKSKDFDSLLTSILAHQLELRLSVPSKESSQHYWHYIIEEIIHFASIEKNRQVFTTAKYNPIHKS